MAVEAALGLAHGPAVDADEWTCELWVVLSVNQLWCRNILIRTWPAASYCRMHATSDMIWLLAHNNTTKLLHSALIGQRTRIARLLPDLATPPKKTWPVVVGDGPTHHPPTAVRVPAIYRPISTQYQTCGGITWTTMHAEQINQWVGMVGHTHTPLNFMVP